MSEGLPVVASNVVGNKDTIIHNQTGYLYELGNFTQASLFISELLKSNKLNQNGSKNKFSTKKMF